MAYSAAALDTVSRGVSRVSRRLPGQAAPDAVFIAQDACGEITAVCDESKPLLNSLGFLMQ